MQVRGAANLVVVDTCNTSNPEKMIHKLQAESKVIMQSCQASDPKPKIYDHFTEDKTTRLEGHYLVHMAMPARDLNQYKTISGC